MPVKKELFNKKQETTALGTRLTTGTQAETTTKPSGDTYTKQKGYRGAETPATVRLRELSGGSGFLKEGTPEQIQFRKEFPQGDVNAYDPEEAAFFDPSLNTPSKLGRDELQFLEKQKQLQLMQ